MAHVGAVLGWKFNHAQGITTFNNIIKEWPSVLGPKPTQEQLDAWNIEYENYLNELEQAEAEFENNKAEAIMDLLPSRQQLIDFFSVLRSDIAAVSNIATAKAAMTKIEMVLEKLVQLEYMIIKNSLT